MTKLIGPRLDPENSKKCSLGPISNRGPKLDPDWTQAKNKTVALYSFGPK